MFLIKNIGDSLDDLGYPDLNQLENYLANLNFVNFSKLINWLSINLNQTSTIESTVNAIENEQETDCFKIELSSLLKELGSPFSIDQLDDFTNKLTILNYLCGELFASSIDFVKRSNRQDQEYDDESEIAKQLRLILMSLGISKPPANVTSKQIFEKITECLNTEFKKRNIIIENSLLFKNVNQNQISPKIWSKLDELNELLKQEYEIRKCTLITRSDCTVTSFKFGLENQNNSELEKKISELYTKFNYLLERNINIDISNLMAIKPSDFNKLNNVVISKSHQLCSILPPKNSQLANQGLQQKISLQKFIIGSVPDRGGRTEESIKPELETFSQQQQNYNKNQNRNFTQQNNQRQNFNLKPNRVQGSGWNQQYQDRSFNNNARNFSGQSGDNNYGNNLNNNKYNQRFDQQDQNNEGSHFQQRNRGGYHGGNRNDGNYNNRGSRRGGRY